MLASVARAWCPILLTAIHADRRPVGWGVHVNCETAVGRKKLKPRKNFTPATRVETIGEHGSLSLNQDRKMDSRETIIVNNEKDRNQILQPRDPHPV
jgi:hypothetical protein